MDWFWAIKDTFWRFFTVGVLVIVWKGTTDITRKYPRAHIRNLYSWALVGSLYVALAIPGDISNSYPLGEDDVPETSQDFQLIEEWEHISDRGKIRNFLCLAITAIASIWYERRYS